MYSSGSTAYHRSRRHSEYKAFTIPIVGLLVLHTRRDDSAEYITPRILNNDNTRARVLHVRLAPHSAAAARRIQGVIYQREQAGTCEYMYLC
jgi:hypothetical protein